MRELRPLFLGYHVPQYLPGANIYGTYGGTVYYYYYMRKPPD